MATNEDAISFDKDAISPDVVNGPPLPIDDWPDYPLLLCIHGRHKDYIHTNHDNHTAIPINTVFELESKAFKGQGIIRMADTPNCDKKYFKGRRRKSAITTQGTFKRRIRFDHVFTGQLFDRRFRNVPTQYLISAGLKIVKTLAPSLKADIDSDCPHLMSPWASACQVFNICKQGDEIPLPAETTENIELLDPKFKGMSFSQRKALFHDRKELEKYYFEPGYVYTMSFYSHMFAPTTYSLHMLKMKWGIQSYIPAPMQINAIIFPESEDISNIVDSSSNIIGDTTINDKLLDEILKEKSASIETTKSNNNKTNTNNNNNNNNNNSNEQEKKKNTNNKNEDQNVDNGDNDSSSSVDDVPKTGRDRNPAVDATSIGTALNIGKSTNKEEKEKDKGKDKGKDKDKEMEKEQETKTNNTTTQNNNDNDSDNDNDEKKEPQLTVPTGGKSMSEMTIDEKYEAINADKDFHLLDCEMIYSFSVWHVKLVDELYNGKYSIRQKSKNKGSIFSSKKKSADDSQAQKSDNVKSGSGSSSSQSMDSSFSNKDTDDDSNRKGSLSFGLFGKKW